MKNTIGYFNWHYIVLALFALLCVFALMDGTIEYLMFMIPVMIPVALVQVVTAIDYTLSAKLPEHFQSDWRTYWIMTALYFVILLLLFQSADLENLYAAWLYGIPWLIVIYQVSLVSRIYKWKLTNKVNSTNQINSKS